MRVTIPDALADVYQRYADRRGVSLDVVLAEQLGRFKGLPPGQRAVVLGGGILDTLESALATGQLRDGDDLVAKVSRLAGITFHEVRLDFSPNQLEELAHRAERQGKPVAQLAAEIIRQVTEQFFWGTGGGAAAASFAPPAPTPAYTRESPTGPVDASA